MGAEVCIFATFGFHIVGRKVIFVDLFLKMEGKTEGDKVVFTKLAPRRGRTLVPFGILGMTELVVVLCLTFNELIFDVTLETFILMGSEDGD